MSEEDLAASLLVARFDHSEIPAPSSTPVKTFRFSDCIHGDRHLFLKGASLGVGFGGGSDFGGLGWEDYTSPIGAVSGYDVKEDSIWSPAGQLLNENMALGSNHLPSLHRVHLSLSSADLSSRQQLARLGETKHHQQPVGLQPPVRASRQMMRRPLNEKLNTYVETQKRIRSVQSLDDLHRKSPPPLLPFLSSRRRRVGEDSDDDASADGSRRRDAFLRLTPTLTPRDDAIADSPACGKPRPSSRLPVVKVSGPRRACCLPSPFGDSNGLRQEVAGMTEDLDEALMEARQALRSMRGRLGRKYTNYSTPDFFQPVGADSRQANSGRMFASYPRRVLVHPARLWKQRTEAFLATNRKILRL